MGQGELRQSNLIWSKRATYLPFIRSRHPSLFWGEGMQRGARRRKSSKKREGEPDSGEPLFLLSSYMQPTASVRQCSQHRRAARPFLSFSLSLCLSLSLSLSSSLSLSLPPSLCSLKHSRSSRCFARASHSYGHLSGCRSIRV